jgi:hypothetical protein
MNEGLRIKDYWLRKKVQTFFRWGNQSVLISLGGLVCVFGVTDNLQTSTEARLAPGSSELLGIYGYMYWYPNYFASL